jgi:hypothetical protein
LTSVEPPEPPEEEPEFDPELEPLLSELLPLLLLLLLQAASTMDKSNRTARNRLTYFFLVVAICFPPLRIVLNQ